MKVESQYSDPEHVKDRHAYRVRIEGKDGQVIEIVEQMGGGFYIAGVNSLNAKMAIEPFAANAIIIQVK